MAIEAITLALDGVIFDTEDMHLRACNAAFEECGLGLRWSVRQFSEAARVRGAANAIVTVIEKLGLPANSKDAARLVQEKRSAFHDIALAGSPAIDTSCLRLMEEALDDGCKLAVVSDMPAQTATAMLEAAFEGAVTNLFSVVVCGADLDASAGNGPHRLALRTMGVEAADCAAIDAAVPGLLAAKRAGIWTMAVTPHEKDIARIAGADAWCPQWQAMRHGLERKQSISFDCLNSLKNGRQPAMPTRLAA